MDRKKNERKLNKLFGKKEGYLTEREITKKIKKYQQEREVIRKRKKESGIAGRKELHCKQRKIKYQREREVVRKEEISRNERKIVKMLKKKENDKWKELNKEIK